VELRQHLIAVRDRPMSFNSRFAGYGFPAKSMPEKLSDMTASNFACQGHPTSPTSAESVSLDAHSSDKTL
jgi:hypothetical protein